MTRTGLLIMLLSLFGCASLRMGEGGGSNRLTLSQDLSRGTKLLAAGDSDGAARQLGLIVAAPGVSGVTDEALFRLALLHLGAATEKEGVYKSLQLLSRLKKEYPASIWTVQSEPLAELLAGVEEMRRQNRSYRNLNQSLSNEVKELNRNIDQLKRLDLELEKKSR